MITNGSITLWHSGGYDTKTRMDLPSVRTFFSAVSIQKDIAVNIDKGLETADVIKIRIPGSVDIQIKNGDRIMLGEHTSEEPPGEAFTVKGFADNRRGTVDMHHWKVICG